MSDRIPPKFLKVEKANTNKIVHIAETSSQTGKASREFEENYLVKKKW